jgi:hypothetical protein
MLLTIMKNREQELLEKVLDLLDYFAMHILNNIIFQHYFMGIQDLHVLIKRLF